MPSRSHPQFVHALYRRALRPLRPVLLASLATLSGSACATENLDQTSSSLMVARCDEACVVEQFKSFSKVYRPSGREEAARAWVRARIDEAVAAGTWKRGQITTATDAPGNMLVRVPATGRFVEKNLKPIAIQTHLDMIFAVAGATPGQPLDPFFENGVEVVEEDGILHSKDFKTTLGADDGASVAQAVRYILDRNLPHPALELVFTANEESGLVGAIALEVDKLPLRARALINMDGSPTTTDVTADPGILIGANGGAMANLSATLPAVTLRGGEQLVKMSLTGLRGGHSGNAIAEKRMNSIRAFGALVAELATIDPGTRLVDVNVGEVATRKGHNKIPDAFAATLAVSEATDVAAAAATLQTLFASLLREATAEVPANVSLKIEALPAAPVAALSSAATRGLAHTLGSVPNGVILHNPAFPLGAERSSNLGILGVNGGAHAERSFFVGYMPRGFDSEKTQQVVQQIFESFRATIRDAGGTEPELTQNVFMPWLIDRDSKLVQLAQRNAPILRSITILAAGTEPGVFADKYPQLKDRVIGIVGARLGAHTPQERISVAAFKAQTTAIQQVIEGFADDPTLLQ